MAPDWQDRTPEEVEAFIRQAQDLGMLVVVPDEVMAVPGLAEMVYRLDKTKDGKR